MNFSVIAQVLIVVRIVQVGSALCIDGAGGIDSLPCLENRVCCKSLTFLSNQVKNDITIDVVSDAYLNGILELVDIKDITIQGNGNIYCNSSISNTGVYIKNVSNLILFNLTFTQCSMIQTSSSAQVFNHSASQLVLCAVYIIECTNLTIENVTISNSIGTGMHVYNTHGTVQILGSTFKNNTVSDRSRHSGGGGLKIEFTPCQFEDCNYVTNSSYTIHDSSFINNSAFENHPNLSSYAYGSFQGQGRGGGLYFTLRGDTNGNKLDMKNCMFVGNQATTWGGGVYLSFRDNSSSNDIRVESCTIDSNTCLHVGGGGVNLNFLTYKGTSKLNKVVFRDCSFVSNKGGTRGGGLAISSSRENDVSNILLNAIKFDNCTWYRNSAVTGAAIDISPSTWDVLGNGILPMLTFADCTLRENYVAEDVIPISDGIEQKSSGTATMLVSNSAVHFEGVMRFLNNTGSGLLLQSGIVNLKSGTEMQMIGNVAKFGGAIALYAFSVIYVNENTTVHLTDNKADLKGGAIYFIAIDIHERETSSSCFIQKGERTDVYSNMNIFFARNMAKSRIGNSIFASSLKPCQYNCRLDTPNNLLANFKCIGNIQGLTESEIATSYIKFEHHDSKMDKKLSEVVPGQYFRIPVIAYDEFNKPVSIAYDVSLKHDNTIKLDSDSTSVSYVSNSTLQLHATAEKKDDNVLVLSKEHTAISLNITAIECPPGFIIKKSSDICTCDTSLFKGTWKCGRKTASILNGFWIGLCDQIQCTGNCYIGLCTNKLSIDLTERIGDTHKLICSENRRGKLCGECAENHSVYYHSESFRCGKRTYCKYGILFYLLSEILPLTVLFIVVIVFNISFTTGSVNGIILYAQILDSFVGNVHTPANFSDSKQFQQAINVMKNIYKATYEVFNLNYFSIERLSFCLWDGVTSLDVIAWKYVTITYAFLLIIATVLLLNTTRCKRMFNFWRPHNLRISVIHGFSAFLVMCYSQCVKVSFQLLTYTTLVGHNFTVLDRVLLYSGEHKPFDAVHVKYGVPAILFILTIVILPPVLLFLYPLSFKILALCRLSELTVVNKISSIVPVQFFDAFQSCYKDKFRFFSGMYFFYRVVPLFIITVNTEVAKIYFYLQVFLILALALNAIFQPYKKQWHNTTDTLIFVNLALINGITAFNHQIIHEGKDKLKEIKVSLNISILVQLILIYLPLLYIIVCAVLYIVRWGKRRIHEKKSSQTECSEDTLLDSTYLPPLRNRISVYPEDLPFYEMK